VFFTFVWLARTVYIVNGIKPLVKMRWQFSGLWHCVF
jgi:hypothetical protein